MKNTYELKQAYQRHETVSVSAMIKAKFFIETEATKMLTAQLNDLWKSDKTAAAKKVNSIRRAGYVYEISGNMDKARVFEVTC